MSYKFTQYTNQTVFNTDHETILVFNKLFGLPLYAWWCVTIPTFKEGEILGTLTDAIQDKFDGPFDSRIDAENYIMTTLDLDLKST